MKIKACIPMSVAGKCTERSIVDTARIGNNIHTSWMKWAGSCLRAQDVFRSELEGLGLKYSLAVSENEGIQSLISGGDVSEELRHGWTLSLETGGSGSRRSVCLQHSRKGGTSISDLWNREAFSL